MLLGADIGGTFTDLVWWTGTELRSFKLSTTPAQPEEALIAGIESLGAGTPDVLIVHGSTIATNAFLERRGARVVLVTTAGFADVLEIGRQNRIGIYDPRTVKPAPLVPAERRLEADERLDAQGAVLTPLTAAEVERVVAAVADQVPEAIAICLLHAYADTTHEARLAAALRAVSPFVYSSGVVDPTYREYERMSTTVINAYVAPLVAAYVARLRELVRGPLRLMGSDGGRQTSAELQRPASMILSGPAGGVIGAHAVAKAAGIQEVITLDMGGTSTDVALLPGEPLLTRETLLDGLPLRAPMLDIYTIGAGGGSLARFDRGGALLIGPQSAGAQPGPACYGRGGSAFTVTDAHLLLGHILPEYFLGGRMTLDSALAEAAGQATLQATPGAMTSLTELAEGVIAVADAAMERAVRTVSARRGYDPAAFTLLCFGGAGGLHAVALAQALGMRGVLMPRAAGTLSALGMLLAQTQTTRQRSILRELATLDEATLTHIFSELAQAATEELLADGYPAEHLHTVAALDLRYRGQSYEIQVGWQGTLVETSAAFASEHTRRFGYADPTGMIEAVNAIVTVRAPQPTFPFPEVATGPDAPPLTTTLAWFAGEQHQTAIYHFDTLMRDQRIAGPAIIAEASSTLLLPPGVVAQIDRIGNIHVPLAEDGERPTHA